jgi:hypothetical protein
MREALWTLQRSGTPMWSMLKRAESVCAIREVGTCSRRSRIRSVRVSRPAWVPATSAAWNAWFQSPPHTRSPVAAALDATDKDVSIGGAGLAAAAIELGLVDELRIFRYPVLVGGGTPFLPPVTEDVPLDLIETRTFGSRVIYERYGRAGDASD